MSSPKLPPSVCDWTSDSLPRCIVRGGRSTPLPFGAIAPPYLATGPADQPFDFCAHIRRLTTAVVAECPDFRHIDVARIMFSVTPARTGRVHGLHARVTPMRFRNGEIVHLYGRTYYRVQRFLLDGKEVLYVMTFCLPRFLNLSFDEKFVTLFHELYHIGPAFDGDLRRHHGRCHLHTHSKKKYDEQMGHFARAYLGNGADPNLHAFLRLNFAQLQHRHGSVVGVNVPRPKVVPVRSPTEY